jgi:hypothetical protein
VQKGFLGNKNNGLTLDLATKKRKGNGEKMMREIKRKTPLEEIDEAGIEGKRLSTTFVFSASFVRKALH